MRVTEPSPLPLTQTPESDQAVKRDRAVQDYCIQILQDRAFSLPVRLIRLGRAIRAGEAVERRGAPAILQEVRNVLSSTPSESELTPDIRRAFEMQRTLMAELAADSQSLAPYLKTVFAALGIQNPLLNKEDNLLANRYQEAAARLNAAFPKWQIYFEHMMVNHVFFDGYPYSDRHESLEDEHAALCAVYAVLRFTAAGWMMVHTGLDALVDVCAAAFRLIEHSSFTWNAPVVLRRAGMKAVQDLDGMVQV